MRTFFSTLLVLAVLTPVHAQAPAPSRGELLYNTHCIACHSTQMHWREQRLARDWPSLKAQVRRFQGVAGLAWTEEDIGAVTRHLNDTIYRFPETQARR
jgi:mono/diheme cytochrome c family protein